MEKQEQLRKLAREANKLWGEMSERERDSILASAEKYSSRFDRPIGSMLSSLARLLQ